MQHAAMRDLPGEPAALNRRETTYLCAADKDGMMVSLIQTTTPASVQATSCPCSASDFRTAATCSISRPGRLNSYAPGKRRSTIIPAFLTKEGKPLMAFGLMGGDNAAAGHAQVVVNLVDFRMNLRKPATRSAFITPARPEPTGTVMTDGGVLHIEDGCPTRCSRNSAAAGPKDRARARRRVRRLRAIWRDP